MKPYQIEQVRLALAYNSQVQGITASLNTRFYGFRFWPTDVMHALFRILKTRGFQEAPPHETRSSEEDAIYKWFCTLPIDKVVELAWHYCQTFATLVTIGPKRYCRRRINILCYESFDLNPEVKLNTFVPTDKCQTCTEIDTRLCYLLGTDKYDCTKCQYWLKINNFLQDGLCDGNVL